MITEILEHKTDYLPVVNILLVEDDTEDFYLVSMMLKMDKTRQYHIEHRCTLAEGLHTADRMDFDAVLLDLGLPDSSGLETLKEFNHGADDIPVIVLTGVSDDIYGKQAIHYGAADYLPKNELDSRLLIRSISHSVERNKLLQEIQIQAQQDYLTGLFNRRCFIEKLDFMIELSDRNNQNLALAFIDLNNFKSINDSFGHNIGDEVLKIFSKRLDKSFRKSDIISRMGGDEFALIMSNYESIENLCDLIEGKSDLLEKPIRFDIEGVSHLIKLGISIGIAEWQQGISRNRLLACADKAMYQCKSNQYNEASRKRVNLYQG